MSNQNLLSSDLRIDEVCHMHLKETAKWTKFLAIVGFVITGIIVLVALFAGSILAEMPVSETAGVGAGLVTFIYIIIAVIYFFVSLYLYRFGAGMLTALNTSSQDELAKSFMNLKLMNRLIGIIVLAYIGLMVLGLLISFIAMMFS
ncbi:MAG TPA: hypothetical protein PKY29_05700 [Ferruginibacter sp.]|nr:hypothetical protein [Ferruginibacter sp.]HRN80452.1 hypothetical protein [Ferruginibacter sp.]HRO18166.1 hypothetical protein [Ferruginibacter sp.]HRQ20789.1 hypothetical protein [Ferruginibacter sp.]